ncbi:hypothetical protein [Myceligenerans halotolerans]
MVTAEKAQRIAENKKRALGMAPIRIAAVALLAWLAISLFTNSWLWSFVVVAIVAAFWYAIKAATINDMANDLFRLIQKAEEAADEYDRHAPIRVGDTARAEAVKNYKGLTGRVIAVWRLYVVLDDGTRTYKCPKAAVARIP